jgi:hypothetical protein
MLATYGVAKPNQTQKTPDLQKRAIRYYDTQVLVPDGSVLPCLNATDCARRDRRSRIRKPEAPVVETYCDITPLLEDDSKTKSSAVVDEWGDEDAIRDMMVSEDDVDADNVDEVSKEFEFVEFEVISENNGTVRRWYKGFRHWLKELNENIGK